MKKKGRRPISIAVFVLAVLLMGSLFAGCGRDSGNNYAPDKGGSEAALGSDAIAVNESSRKVIYNVYCNIETDDASAAGTLITDNTLALGGYVQSSSENLNNNSGNYAKYTLRIPTAKLNDFVALFKDFGEVKAREVSTEDITLQYINVQAEVEAIKESLKAYDEMILTATPENVIKYSQQKEALNIRLNKLMAQINQYDDLVEMSTVSISLYTVGTAPVEIDYGEQIGNTFMGSLNVFLDILKFIGLAIVAVAPYAAVGTGGFFGIRAIHRAYRRKHPKAKSGSESKAESVYRTYAGLQGKPENGQGNQSGSSETSGESDKNL